MYYLSDESIYMMISGYFNCDSVNTVVINGIEEPVVNTPGEIVSDVMQMYPNADRDLVTINVHKPVSYTHLTLPTIYSV